MLLKILKLDAVMPPDQPDQLLSWSAKSVATGATTIMECGIAMALKMSGMQRQRHLASLVGEFQKHVKDIQLGGSPLPTPSDHVFPALHSITRSSGSAHAAP